MSSDGTLDNAAFKRALKAQDAGSVEIPYTAKGLKPSAASMAAQGFGYTGLFTLALGMTALIIVIFLVSREGGNRAGYVMPGDNCTVITCPAGPSGGAGPAGPAGPPGAQGPSGPSGPQGSQGNNGLPGPEGPMGQCSNTNPACLQGATGPTGANGIPGPTGLPGLIGPTGPQGVIGPQGFIGPTGPQGVIGVTGVTGPQGVSGACDCESLPLATINNLNITNTFTMSGSMTCPGGAMDSNCFGLTGPCPNYETCYLTSLGLYVNSSSLSVIPTLQVGMGISDNGKSIVQFGQLPTNYVDKFTVNAKSFSVATYGTTMDFSSLFGDVLISSSGGAGISSTLSSSGAVIINAGNGINVASMGGSVAITSAAASLTLAQSTSNLLAVSSTFSSTSIDFVFRKPSSLTWFRSNSTNSLTCATTGPHANLASSSIEFPTDVIFDGNLLTRNTDGLIKMAGLNLCGQIVKTTGGTLQLQDATASKILDIRATITNSDSGFGVTFLDASNGVNFQDTAIHNINGLSGPLNCDDAEGFIVSGVNATLWARSIQDATNATVLKINTVSQGDIEMSSVGFTTHIKGNLIVDGTTIELSSLGFTTRIKGHLVVDGTITAASGGCCTTTSDIRAKHNITTIAPVDDLQLLLAMPRRVAFQYTDEYQKVDPSADNNVHHGFIAQELEQVMPRTVHLVNQTIDGVKYSDFRKLTLDRIVPHVVGAVKQLHTEHLALKEEVAFLKHLVKELLLKSKK